MVGRVSLCDQRIRLGSVEVGGDQEMQHSLFYNLEKSERNSTYGILVIKLALHVFSRVPQAVIIVAILSKL